MRIAKLRTGDVAFSVVLLLLSASQGSYWRDDITRRRGDGGEPAQRVQRSPKPCAVWSLPALLQKDNILPPYLGQVIGHGCAHDSTTTDDHLRLGRQGDRMRLGSRRAAPPRRPVLPSSAGPLSSGHRQQPVKHHVCQQLGGVLSLG